MLLARLKAEGLWGCVLGEGGQGVKEMIGRDGEVTAEQLLNY